MIKAITVAALAVTALATGAARADEGMYLFNNFPAAKLGEKYGFTPDQAWMDKVRLSTVRLARGCSGSFVSKDGLVLTNHHCAHSCIDQISDKKEDLVANGFVAKDAASERKCPDVEINQLLQITEVTDRIAKATEGKEGAEFSAAQRAASAEIQKECATDDSTRCDVVTFYQGGRYDLYKYKRFQDVRLAFAPEVDIAAFGGDPDNFNFPRYDLDMALLRVYVDGKPFQTENYLPLAKASAAQDELVFVAGNPGTTSRLKTVAQLEFERNYAIPKTLARLSEMRGILLGYGDRGAAQKRTAEHDLLYVENSLKVYKGRLSALSEGDLLPQIRERETALRGKVDADPALKQVAGGAWDAVAVATVAYRNVHDRFAMLEGAANNPAAFNTDLFTFARQLVRAANERAKPNGERLKEYTDASFPSLQQKLVNPQPVHAELEAMMMGLSLSTMRQWLTPDDEAVKLVLGKEAPEALAKKLVAGTKLGDAKVRKQLLDGGKAAIEASKDPLILLAKAVDPVSRAVRAEYENKVDAPLRKAGAEIAKARFKIDGTSNPPDATLSPRLNFGTVKGWEEKGKQVPYATQISGLYERATGNDPFRIPATWLAAKASLDPKANMNFVTTNDIVGGNSGSPIFNKKRELVGLAFDGNIHSIGGDYGYVPSNNRCVGVDVMAIRSALGTVYKGADRLLKEMDTGQPGG